MVIIDTNIIIDHLRQKNRKVSWLQKMTEGAEATKIAISVVSIQELYTGKSISTLENEETMLNTIASYEIKSYSYEIAKKAGELVRNSNGQLQFADAAIAATAIVNDAQLATLNKKDFEDIKDLVLFK
ncbi:hypothetical protein A2773_05630 [Candidatus Gottesmanbacteria bacterium RIFCSPHIGHO2_01_FULL_39_10]|uniref:PIN domain-containing protein n=1 Tax=Candidatus Gottesmanbacteria bacterium RIFCSPHIGHO2_01_FULL_39_10 TaxID=1798375 RepID=A0A1F5ZPZ1_9BACT|nr:MAG: hypothetical protein A2773_05630 [Candidatus Gottesmanbacteria bacterium RIFCSPHIGHO2_01_FULL_39_10]